MDRIFAPFDRELKLAPDESDTKMSFSGHGAVFGNVDAYGDVIAPGAFKKTLKEAKQSKQWPAMLMQHGGWGLTSEDLMPIGVWTELEEDDVGLATEGVLADTTKGLDTYKLLKMQPRPAINGLSIGYIPIRWKARSKPEEPRRTLEEVKLLEISLVTFPANAKARVRDVKSMEEQISTLADAERFLRDACGFSRQEAVAFVARVKGASRSDSGSLSEVRDALLRRGKAISTK